MQINGHELKFSMTNAYTASQFEKALTAMQQAAQELENSPPQSLADGIRRQIQSAEDFIVCIFGDSVTLESLDCDTNELMDCLDVVEQVIDEANTQKEKLDRRFSRYAPNRAKRRAARR